MVGMDPAWKVRFSTEHVKSGSEAHNPHIEEKLHKKHQNCNVYKEWNTFLIQRSKDTNSLTSVDSANLWWLHIRINQRSVALTPKVNITYAKLWSLSFPCTPSLHGICLHVYCVLIICKRLSANGCVWYRSSLKNLRNFQLCKTKNVTAMFQKPTSGPSLWTYESCSHLHVLRSILILPSHLHQIFYCKYSNIYCGIKTATAARNL